MKRTKRHEVVLRSRTSSFVQIFRTTPTQTVCPNFYVLAHANGCGFAPLCSYCYLKSSFWHLKGQHAFTNKAAMFKEIRSWLKKDNLESYVLNAGNLSDSLSFEKHRPLVSDLVELFRAEAEAKKRRHILLLVTKGGTKEVEPLLKVKPCTNVVVSFSMNSPDAGSKYEAGAAPVKDRLKAARLLRKKGWRIRIRIDPMIAGWSYGWITRQVKSLSPERVTLGTLRAEANLDKFVKLPALRELEKSADRKSLSRYPMKQRLKMYKDAIDILGSSMPIGLCEETYEVWNKLGLKTEDKPCNCGG